MKKHIALMLILIFALFVMIGCNITVQTQDQGAETGEIINTPQPPSLPEDTVQQADDSKIPQPPALPEE